MVTLAVLPGMLRISLVIANLANPGNFNRAINLLVSQRGIVGLGPPAAGSRLGVGPHVPEPGGAWPSSRRLDATVRTPAPGVGTPDRGLGEAAAPNRREEATMRETKPKARADRW